MKNRGFTLVELLAVITILALILILVVPNIAKSTSTSKKKLYDTKVSNILGGAVQYGQDEYASIVSENDEDEEGNFYIRRIIVQDLVPKYVPADKEESTVIDPRDNIKNLNSLKIKIKINKKTREVTAEVEE